MFDFDNPNEEKKSPQQKIKECLNDMVSHIDSTKNYDRDFYNVLKAIVDDANKSFLEMSPTEQAKINLYWQSITMSVPNIGTYLNLGSMMAAGTNALVQAIRGHAINAIALLS